MLKKGASYLILSSFLLIDAASSMDSKEENLLPPSSHVSRNPSTYSVKAASSSGSPSDFLNIIPRYSISTWKEQMKPIIEVALQKDVPIVSRQKAFSSIYLFIDLLDEPIRERLKSLETIFLNAEDLPFEKRFTFLPGLDKKTPVATLLSLACALEPASDESCEELSISRFIELLMSYNHAETQEGIERCFFKRPGFFLYGGARKKWLSTTLEMSDEDKRASMLQKIHEVMSSAKDVTQVVNAAKYILQYDLDNEPVIGLLWKLIKGKSEMSEEEERDDSEENETLIMVSKILLKYTSPSPIRESVLSRLFSEAEQELFPSALVLLLTQEESSISIRAKELAERRLFQDNLDYTLDLFFNLEEENLAQDLRYKIQERLKAKFNDPKTDKDVLSSLAPRFLRTTDENLSLKAFNCLKQDIIDSDNPEYVESIVYQIIEAVGVDHPWAQEVINIGIEKVDDPFSSIRGYNQLVEKVKESVEHHPTLTQLSDGRFVTFNIETLHAPRLLSHFLPVQHFEFMALMEDLRKEVRENPAAKEEFLTISKNIPVKTLVSKANESYFKNLLDSEAGQGVISLISFKLRRIITDIMALYVETQTTAEPSSSSSSMVTDASTAPSQRGLSPASRTIAQFLVNVMQCGMNKDEAIDNTYRLWGYEKVISEEGMRTERLITTAREHIMEDLRQMREGLLNGEGPVVKELLFGTQGNQNRKIDKPPYQGKYLGNLLGGELGSFLEGQSVSYDLYGGCVEEKLRSYSRQQVLDTLHRHFKPEAVIKHYHEQFNKEGRNGHPTSLISALMGEEMFVMAPEGKVLNDQYSTLDPRTGEFKEYKPLLIAEVLLRLNILREVQAPSLATEASSPSSSMVVD
ncbi:MAG: hypothetical protein K2X28_05300 [Alphaproteobacteria bacterium]|nr:hypothetical protein [Alphaproteobacteria bacterium]